MKKNSEQLVEYIGMKGFEVNYDKGKTEAIIAYSGENAKFLKQQIVHEMRRTIFFTGANRVQKQLRVVESYKHLGSHAAPSGSPHKDVVLKTRAIGPATSSLRNRIFKLPRRKCEYTCRV